jgi:small multidrug resistance pump
VSAAPWGGQHRPAGELFFKSNWGCLVGLISPRIIALLTSAIVLQLIGTGLLPRTRGFTAPVPTIIGVTAFVSGLWLLAKLTQSGVNLGILVPIMATVMPLVSIAIGVFAYGEHASPLKIILLVSACGMVGFASRVA